MNPYASLADLTTFGLPATALGAVTTAQQQAQLDAAAGRVDSKIGGRYVVPLTAPIPAVITQTTCKIAAWEVLRIRGWNPMVPGDKAIFDGFVDANAWLDAVQHQREHLVGVAQTGSAPMPQPVMLSSSVVDLSTGATLPNRGW